MSIKTGKRELGWMIEALDQDHLLIEDAANAALEVCQRILQSRASWVVVGQLARTMAGPIDPSDPEAIKVCVDLYSTEGDARSAAQTLAIAHATNEEYRVWVLPVAGCTTAALLSERRKSLQAAEEKRAEKERERRRAEFAKYAEQRVARLQEFLDNEAAA